MYQCHSRLDPGVELLLAIYAENFRVLGPIRWCTFIDSLEKLGLGFTKLQVMKIAADCGMFPLSIRDYELTSRSPLPGIQLDVGEIGRASYCGNRRIRLNSLLDWKLHKRSRHVQDRVRNDFFYQDSSDFCLGLGLRSWGI